MSIKSSKDPESFNSFEHRGWESVSQSYEQHFAELTSQSVDKILNAAAVENGKQVLDVCCGSGVITAGASARGAQTIGIDFSSSAVEIASKNVPDADVYEANAQSLPFPDNTFDAVVCGFGIIHVPNPKKCLSEMYRVLKPSGCVAVSVWALPNPNTGFGLLYGAIKKYADMNVHLPHGPDFFQFSDPQKLTEALLETGFKKPSVNEAFQTWELTNPQGLFDGIMEGAVRAKALIAAQTSDIQKSILKNVVAGVNEHLSPDGVYRVPMPALIGSAIK